MENKTPTCDKHKYETDQGAEVVPLHIAIELECKLHEREREIGETNAKWLKSDKQLAEARAEIERLALELENKQYTITCASEENQQLKESLAEARAEIEKQDTLLEKCLSLLKQQKERGES